MVLGLLAFSVAALSVLSFIAILLHTHRSSMQESRKNSTTGAPVPVPPHILHSTTGTTSTPSAAMKAIRRSKKDPHLLYHFVHIPKCGGTSMTAILREMACHVDPAKNKDCCTNPGFCEHNDDRRCKAIKGCVNHFPQRAWIFEDIPSITIMREPTSRLLSAWFYRGHSPNNDFFQVRPEFKDIKFGRKPKVTFDEYVEMPEYNNIQTRMLGADSFPYRNVTVTDKVFEAAVEALQAFTFVGLQEAYYISVKLLLREMGMDKVIVAPVIRERHQKPSDAMKALKGNAGLMQRAKDVNSYDYRLYLLGVQKFCGLISKYPDLLDELRTTTQVGC